MEYVHLKILNCVVILRLQMMILIGQERMEEQHRAAQDHQMTTPMEHQQVSLYLTWNL